MSLRSPLFPDDPLLNPFGSRKSAPADATVVRHSPPRGGARPPKSTKPETKLANADEAEVLTPEPEEQPSPGKALLSNPRWDREKAKFGDTVAVLVDGKLDSAIGHLTKVTFEVRTEDQKPSDPFLQSAEGHIKDGIAKAELTLKTLRDKETGSPLDHAQLIFTAKHLKSEILKGPKLEVGAGDSKPFDGVIFYSPAKKQYLVCETEKEFKAVSDNTRTLDVLRDRSAKAWKIVEAEKRHEALKQVAEDAGKIFGGKAIGDSKKGFEDLILVQQNKAWGKVAGWTYISTDDPEAESQAGMPKRYPPEKVQEKLDKLLARTPKEDKKAGWKGKVKASIFKTDPITGQAWEWREPQEAHDPKDPPAFSHTTEAAIGHYLAGWDGGEIAYDTKKKTLDMGVSGKASYSLFEGKMGLKLDLPGPKGANVIGLLSQVKLRDTFLADPTRTCLMKASFEGALTAFVGISVHGALGLQLTAGPREEGKAEAGGFGGLQFGAGGKASALWSPGGSIAFASLGNIGYDATWSAGIGAKGALKVGYNGSKFYLEMEAGATLGLGGSGAIKWEVDAREAIQFIGHLFNCVNFHFVVEVAKEAHRAYVNYSYAYHVAQAEHYKRQAEWAQESHAAFSRWLEKIGPKLGEIKRAMFESSLSYSMLEKIPPEALAQSIRTVMAVREQDDFRVIKNLLNSTVAKRPYDKVKNPTGNHKLKWVLRYLDEEPLPEKLGGSEADSKVAEWKGRSIGNGIQSLIDFSLCQGKWKKFASQGRNDTFVEFLHDFLKKNEVKK